MRSPSIRSTSAWNLKVRISTVGARVGVGAAQVDPNMPQIYG
jgi:hypothetical protein